MEDIKNSETFKKEEDLIMENELDFLFTNDFYSNDEKETIEKKGENKMKFNKKEIMEKNNLSQEDWNFLNDDGTEDTSMFIEEEDGYYYLGGTKPKKITDFILKNVTISSDYIKADTIMNEHKKLLEEKISNLYSKKDIKKLCIGVFYGKTDLIPEFWSWITKVYQENFVETIEYYGLHTVNEQAKFYHPNNSLCSSKELKITPFTKKGCNKNEDNNIIPLFDNYNLEVNKKTILGLRSDINQSLLGICWALGRFHNTEKEYPILSVTGTTSIGKTKYMEFISRICFGTKDNIRVFSSLSEDQIKRLASCSNITPLIIDEYKITADSNSKYNSQNILSLIRSIYDNKEVTKGNTETTLTKYKLITPLILGGESSIADNSVLNRCIHVELTNSNKSSDDIFNELTDTLILEALGRKAIENKLEKQIIISPSDIKKSLTSVKDERQRYNGGCILVGLKALDEIIKLDYETKSNFIKFLDENLSRTVNIIDVFFYHLRLAIQSPVDRDCFFRKVHTKHGIKYFLRLNTLYKTIASERKYIHDNHELLDMNTWKKQLIDMNIISKESSVQKFTQTSEEAKNGTTQKSYQAVELLQSKHLNKFLDELMELDKCSDDNSSDIKETINLETGEIINN